MSRINIYDYDEYGDRRLVGWFDAEAAERFAGASDFDGANFADRNTGDQWTDQVLYHTAGGRWVLGTLSRRQGSPSTWRYVSADAARDWLAANGYIAAVERLFSAPLEPERGPGRPEIGPTVEVRLPRELIAELDAQAAQAMATRAEYLRGLIAEALWTKRTGLTMQIAELPSGRRHRRRRRSRR